jgi:GT2 family glycosyltransferase
MSGGAVVVAVPSWNGRQRTLACLASLARVRRPAIEVVVIDNASADGSAAAVRAAHPNVSLIEMRENRGFTGAANAGLAEARRRGARHCLLLNNDTAIAEDCVERLVAALEDDRRAASAGPTVLYQDRPETVWSAGGAVDWRRGRTLLLEHERGDRSRPDAPPRAVDFVTGCAMLLSMAAVETVGAFDERFFAYFEEAEWCVRAARRGWRVLHVPSARVWHGISPEAREASPLVHYYMTRNRLLFLRLTGAPASAWAHALAEAGRTLASWSVRPRWRHKRAQRNAVARALADFASGRHGRAPLPGA